MMIGLLFIGAGILAGLVAGLFGLGGGAVVVPILTFVLPQVAQFPQQQVIKSAIATSFAIMLVTTINSVRTHHCKGAIQWPIVWRMLPLLLLGVWAGSVVVVWAQSQWIQGLFAGFLALIGVNLICKRPAAAPKAAEPFNRAYFHSSAGGIGLLCGVLGIGGGSLNTPNLHWRGLPMIQAIATAAAAGWPIALVGTVSLAWAQPQPPLPHALGYVYLPAVAGIGVTSVYCSGLGAKLAHRLPEALLKPLFGWVLLGVSVKLALGAD